MLFHVLKGEMPLTLVKIDINAAHRLVPVSLSDHMIVGMCQLYMDATHNFVVVALPAFEKYAKHSQISQKVC